MIKRGNVVFLPDAEKRSREPDAEAPRDPADAVVIILPVVRVERHGLKRARNT